MRAWIQRIKIQHRCDHRIIPRPTTYPIKPMPTCWCDPLHTNNQLNCWKNRARNVKIEIENHKTQKKRKTKTQNTANNATNQRFIPSSRSDNKAKLYFSQIHNQNPNFFIKKLKIKKRNRERKTEEWKDNVFGIILSKGFSPVLESVTEIAPKRELQHFPIATLLL